MATGMQSWRQAGSIEGRPELDDYDEEMISRFVRAYNAQGSDPRVGDFVDFSDGVSRRVSHVYGRDWGADWGPQTSDGGSWNLSSSGMGFSGSLWPHVPGDLLVLANELRYGMCWTFHHGEGRAANDVAFAVAQRVYRCNYPANKYGRAAWEEES